MATAIKVDSLSKAYQLGYFGTGTLSNDLKRSWAKLRGKEDPFIKIGELNDRSTKSDGNVVWSLKDINFEIEQGDAVGIIGRNGAGKSTLLKILSRVTTPTTGSVKVKGRVSSLLEVGTGFHPELSGRENIYLNGAILGMRKKDIARRFDEIVDFSGVERYIDTPVKRYSSGMYVRLAFAVAAHLESEILIVDEVLAVGDAEFQKKCLGKMNDVTRGQGRTVLFVSHNMAAVKTLCTKGIVLTNGIKTFKGTQTDAVLQYQINNTLPSIFDYKGELSHAPGNENIKLLGFYVNAAVGTALNTGVGVVFTVKFYNYQPGINLDSTFELKNMDDVIIFHQAALITTNNDSKQGIYEVTGSLPPFLLNAGTYSFTLIFGKNQRHSLFIINDFIRFDITYEADRANTERPAGVIHLNIPYQIKYSPILS